jgi:hypothetical protein
MIRDAKRFAFSILVSGTSYPQTEYIFLWNDIIPPSKSSFYRAQQELFEVVKAKCLIECANRREEVLPGSIFALDGLWIHRRGVTECIVVFIDCQTKKIVDFEILQKSNAASSQITQEVGTEWKLPLCET